jgi:hypothetical protein
LSPLAYDPRVTTQAEPANSLHGKFTEVSSSTGLGFPLGMFLLAATAVLSPLAPWLYFHARGDHLTAALTIGYHPPSAAWPILGITLGIVIALSVALFNRRSTSRVVAATGFAALAIWLGISIVQYLTAYPGNTSWGIGWGLWLCFGASTCGSVVGIAWVRHSPATETPSTVQPDASSDVSIS